MQRRSLLASALAALSAPGLPRVAAPASPCPVGSAHPSLHLRPHVRLRLPLGSVGGSAAERGADQDEPR
jgi:hypothetical protein